MEENKLVSYLGHNWRELHFSRDISGVNWSPSAPNGHLLTMTNCIAGAERRSTCEGVHGPGNALSRIDCGVLHNASAKLWVSLRFKLDQAFSDLATADQYLWSKRIDANDELNIRLDQNDGTIKWRLTTATVSRFEIETVQDSWEAGVWYHVLASISDTAGIGRLIVDGGAPVLTADVNAAPNGGNVYIGNAGNATTVGIKGVIQDVFVGIDDLLTSEEANLYGGCPPADTVNVYKLNEGEESTAYDDGSGGNNGTLGGPMSWAWGAVRQPVASFAGIDQYAVSTDGVNILGDLSAVWFGRIKSNLNEMTDERDFMTLHIDNSNQMVFAGDGVIVKDIRWHVNGAGGTGVSKNCDQVSNLAIDEYAVLIGTLSAADGSCVLYVNGEYQDSAIGAGQLVDDGSGAQIYVGCEDTPAYFNPSDVLMIGIVEGVLTPFEARTLSRMLNYKFSTGILI